MSTDDHILLVSMPPPRPPRPSRWKVVLAVLVLVLAMLVGGSALVIARVGRPLRSTPFVASVQSGEETTESEKLRRRAAQAVATIEKVRPRGTIIVVDTFRNRLRLYRDGELLRTAICSTGTGRVLRDPRTGRQWVFDTPLGELGIINKRKNPVWAKPDWAFIEEGYLPPPRDSEERFDDVSLGDYGLYMPDGYIIHGTLFKTLLGRRVTHGCVRLGDEDLEFVYKNAPIGSRVYLY